MMVYELKIEEVWNLVMEKAKIGPVVPLLGRALVTSEERFGQEEAVKSSLGKEGEKEEKQSQTGHQLA